MSIDEKMRYKIGKVAADPHDTSPIYSKMLLTFYLFQDSFELALNNCQGANKITL